MYVCTDYVCICVWMYGCMCVCVYVWMYVCMYVCMHVRMYVCMYAVLIPKASEICPVVGWGFVRWFHSKTIIFLRKWNTIQKVEGLNKEIKSSPVPQMAARHDGAHCSDLRCWKCPQLWQGREHIMLLPLPKLWALPTSESEVGAMGAAVFFQCYSRPLFDTFCLGKPVGFSTAQDASNRTRIALN